MVDGPVSSIRFRGLIAPEEPVITGDYRKFARGSLSHRRLPRPVMFTRDRSQGHMGSTTVGRLEQVEYQPGRGWIGSGSFLGPQIIPEVVQAIYLVRQGVSTPSVDLQPDVTYEVVPHDNQPDRSVARVLRGRIAGFTFVPFAAFEETEITVSDESDQAILASAGIELELTSFAVNGSSWRQMPIADRDAPFEFEAAIERILQWSKGRPALFNKAFLYRNNETADTSRVAYHLPIADIINNELTLVPRAVHSAAVFMAGGHGGLPNISEQEQEQIKQVLNQIYDVLRGRFGDPRIKAPWQK
jgi:hypothetical protein